MVSSHVRGRRFGCLQYHELAPPLATSENDSRLWFYDFSTDLLVGSFPDWHAGINPGHRGYGGAVTQIVTRVTSRLQPLLVVATGAGGLGLCDIGHRLLRTGLELPLVAGVWPDQHTCPRNKKTASAERRLKTTRVLFLRTSAVSSGAGGI